MLAQMMYFDPTQLSRSVRRWIAAFLLLAALAPVSPVCAQETGTTSYAALYRALQPALDMGRRDRLIASANVQSKLPGVAPESIRMEIRARSGVRRLSIAGDGSVEFPMDSALLEEDPAVVSNQPRGTLTLSVTLAFRPYPTLRVPYREIREALAQAVEVVAADPTRNGAVVRGVEVQFAPGSDATVSIRGQNERAFMADAGGRVVLIDTPLWHQADVEVEFSEAPLRLLPYIDQGIAR
jgi:hypothetical protein